MQDSKFQPEVRLYGSIHFLNTNKQMNIGYYTIISFHVPTSQLSNIFLLHLRQHFLNVSGEIIEISGNI